MTRSRKSADRSRRLVSGLAIALALAWSAATHLLWQVESRQGKGHSPAVRLVLSALEPSASHPRSSSSDKSSSKTSKETPHVVTQPMLPDGEAPAPCQVRRSLSTDVEVLASIQTPASPAAPADLIRPEIRAHAVPRSADAGSDTPAFREDPTVRLPRPPPSES